MESFEGDVLDTTGETCPIPETLLKQRFKAWKTGQALKFITDDPLATEFVPQLCEKKGYRCQKESQEGTRCTFLISEKPNGRLLK